MFKKILAIALLGAMVVSAVPLVSIEFNYDYLGTTTTTEAKLNEIVSSWADFDGLIDVTLVQVSDKELFQGIGGGVVLLKEVAGNRDLNSFGYYTVNNDNSVNQNLILVGGDAPILSKSFVIGDGSADVDFGFYLQNEDNKRTFYTEKLRNPVIVKGETVGYDVQALVFKVRDKNNEFIPNKYMLAWEDIKLGSSDKDYNDMILSITVVPVPEPGMLSMLGVSLVLLLGSGYFRRRK